MLLEGTDASEQWGRQGMVPAIAVPNVLQQQWMVPHLPCVDGRLANAAITPLHLWGGLAASGLAGAAGPTPAKGATGGDSAGGGDGAEGRHHSKPPSTQGPKTSVASQADGRG